MKIRLFAASLALATLGAQAGQPSAAQQSIPDAPKPQPTLPNLDSVTPGRGASPISPDDATPTATPSAPSAGSTPSAPAPGQATSSAPGVSTSGDQGVIVAGPGEAAGDMETLHVSVNFVDIPFTVKDGKQRQVAGLEPQDIQIYENGLMQHISFFNRQDPIPLSVALVIDQSMDQADMDRVNVALGALPDAFIAQDEVAVFTYNKSTREVTDYTGAQSARLSQAIERSKASGRQPILAGGLEGPLSQTTIVNDQNFDPNTAANRGHSSTTTIVPREFHPLNDAILEAASTLRGKDIKRRRVVYVISDGKDYGSKAKTSEVRKYLLENKIEVDGTLVGDASLPVVGMLDRLHLPLMMRDNVLTWYANETGGNVDAEFRTNSIEKSFAKIAGEIRTRYDVGYYTSEPILDGKYRTIEVRVIGHGGDLNILAKKGYWPTAVMQRPPSTVPIAAP